MAVPTWPDDLGRPLADGFRDTFPDLVKRTETDAGPAKQRRVTTAGAEAVELRYLMTTDERVQLKAFYKGAAAGGGVWFNWRHPVEQRTVAARFVAGSPPSYEPYKPDWLVTVTLEWRG